MKRLNILLSILLLSAVALGQEIRYDTIRVAPGDRRNIHQQTARQQSAKQTSKQQQIRQQQQRQRQQTSFDPSKVRYGANLGMQFSRNYSQVNIGPQLGYQFSPYFMLGAGVTYNYQKNRIYGAEYSTLYKRNMVGANAFAYLYPMRFLVLYAQPEISQMWMMRRNESTGEEIRSSGTVPAFVIGGGLRLGNIHVTANYDLGQHRNSPYSKDVFMGVSVFF